MGPFLKGVQFRFCFQCHVEFVFSCAVCYLCAFSGAYFFACFACLTFNVHFVVPCFVLALLLRIFTYFIGVYRLFFELFLSFRF